MRNNRQYALGGVRCGSQAVHLCYTATWCVYVYICAHTSSWIKCNTALIMASRDIQVHVFQGASRCQSCSALKSKKVINTPFSWILNAAPSLLISWRFPIWLLDIQHICQLLPSNLSPTLHITPHYTSPSFPSPIYHLLVDYVIPALLYATL